MKDPAVIEREVKEMGEDVQKWKHQTKFKGYTSEAFQKLMEEKYSYLNESSKTLFKNVINETIDKNHYKYLLSMMRQVYESTKTPENADKEVGALFSNKYIQPLIENANTSDNTDSSSNNNQ